MNNNGIKKIDEKYIELDKIRKLPKDINQDVLKKVFRCLIEAIIIISYFMVLNIAYNKMNHNRLMEDIKIFSGIFLLLGILFIERGYKKDNFEISLYGIESLGISFHSLSILHVINMYKFEFQYYLLASSYIFALYFVLKAVIIYTKGKKDYLKNLSDIPEIVKEKPQKKEAVKASEREKVKKEDKIKDKENKKEADNKITEKITKQEKPKSAKRGRKKAAHAK